MNLDQSICLVDLPSRGKPRTLRLPTNWLGDVLRPTGVLSVDNLQTAALKALNSPIGCPPLHELVRPRQRVALLVDDYTRLTPTTIVLPLLLDRLLGAGIQPDDICLVIASGSHRAMTAGELRCKLGSAMDQIRVVNPATSPAEDFFFIGCSSGGIPAWVVRDVVEADLRIGVGMVTPHMDAGFSGGAKIVLPGVCGPASVDAFHTRSVNYPDNPLGNPQAPLRMELESFVAEQVPLHYIFNFVLTPHGEIFRCVAGDMVLAQRQGAALARQSFGALADGRYPVVVANSSPYDFDLWQSAKGLWCGDLLTRDGGTLIWVTSAPEGHGGYPHLIDAMEKSPAELQHLLDSGCSDDPKSAATALQIGRMKHRLQIRLVSEGLTARQAARMGIGWAEFVDDAVMDAVMRLLPEERDGCVVVVPQAGFVLPVFEPALS